MGPLLALILICQAGMGRPVAAGNIPDFQEESPAAQAADEQRELVQRYNGLLRALSDFMTAYKSGTIDVKRAKAVRKALRDLEKLEWFKPERSGAVARPLHGN
jgi:hypothetical protein